MAGRGLKSCLQADFLRKIHPTVLLELLLRSLEPLAEKGFQFPADHDDKIDHKTLSGILAEPNDKLSALVEAIYLIANVGIDERFDELLEVATSLPVDVSGLRVTAPDLAARVYLVAPEALERMERANSFRRRRKFESFVAREPDKAIQIEHLSTDMSAIESDLRHRFHGMKRGRRCTVTRKDCPGEIRFLIQRGDPYTRQPSCDDVSSGSVFYRPERTDFVILDVINNELRVNGRDIAVVKLYVSVFCEHLFGDKERFVYSEKYTLEPLKERGSASLECSDIEGMESVTLIELEYRWPGPLNHCDKSQAADVLHALSRRWRVITGTAQFLMAKFSVKLTGEKAQRTVKIKPRNVAEYSHGEEGLIVEEWMRQRGFVLIGSAAKNAKTDAAVAGD